MHISTRILFIVDFLLVLFDGMCSGSIEPLSRIRNNRRSSHLTNCPIPKIKNGSFRMQRAGRMGYFYCASGFEIHGPMSIMCQTGRWKQDLPICIKGGCKSPPQRSNGWVMADEKRQHATLYCRDEYLSAGSSYAYCNGVQWDRELGECRPDLAYSKTCDFETATMCGWTEASDNDFPWVRRNGWDSYEKLESGPKHDHTIGKPLEGHYMVAEATNSRSTQKSRLLSPIHPKADSENACFRFFYHMYGAGVGQLRVIVKPIDENINDIADNQRYIVFQKFYSQGNQWNEGYFEIEPTNTDFQIVIEATGRNGIINDIGIDDVALLQNGDCMKYLKNGTVATTTEETGGIYNIQSCTTRCDETASVRTTGNLTFLEGQKLTEKCDCHPGCLDLDTCCPDYKFKCLENESTDSDMGTSPIDESAEESTIVPNKMTLASEATKSTSSTPSTTSIKPNQTTISSTFATSTFTSISTSISTSTAIPTLSTISKISTPVTLSTIIKPNTSSTSIPTKVPIIKNDTRVTTTMLPLNSAKNATTPIKTTLIFQKLTTIVPRTTQKTTTSMKIELNTTRSMINRVSSTTFKYTTTGKITNKSTYKPTEKTTPKISSTVSTRNTSASTTALKTTFSITQKPTQKTTTQKSTTAKLLPSIQIVRKSMAPDRHNASSTTILAWKTMHRSSDLTLTGWQVILVSISAFAIIGIVSTLTLIIWKRYKTTKWNQYNSQQIEYISNKNHGGGEEPLIRSNSFVIDDAFDAKLVDGVDVVELPQQNSNNTGAKPKLMAMNKARTTTNSTHKMKKISNRSGKLCDQFSEKRCLTADLIDDDQFDFSLQSHI